MKDGQENLNLVPGLKNVSIIDKYYKGKTCDYNPFFGYYTIKYNDGDKEEFTKEEVEEHRIEHKTDKSGTSRDNGKFDIEWINIYTRRINHCIYCILTNHCFF